MSTFSWKYQTPIPSDRHFRICFQSRSGPILREIRCFSPRGNLHVEPSKRSQPLFTQFFTLEYTSEFVRNNDLTSATLPFGKTYKPSTSFVRLLYSYFSQHEYRRFRNSPLYFFPTLTDLCQTLSITRVVRS